MKKIYSTFLFLFCIQFFSFGQQVLTNDDFLLNDRTDDTGIPATDFVIGQLGTEKYLIHIDAPQPFSCVGVAWKVGANDIDPGIFQFEYRTKKDHENWSVWMDAEGDFAPADIPSGHFRTDLLFSYDATNHDELEIRIKNPVQVSEMQINIFDGNYNSEPKKSKAQPVYETNSNRNCPQFPTIIPRSQWCGGSAPCGSVLAGYNPTYISPTHVVIHHGASPNTYTDGQAVVRSYWNYHVNYNGWSDIGYNYLIDKYGNFYQGRHNPSLPTTDVRGAHAGAANSGSIGVNFLGNLDVTLATQPQLDKLYDLLAWWFDHKGYSPLASASMQTQAYGVQVEPRITGHRDIGNTTCPGNDLHAQLPNIRNEVQAVIDACNNVINDNIAPATVGDTKYEWRGYDFWMDFEDNDNSGGSGVDQTFYQVIDFDGTEWRCNNDFGFFNDNFNTAIHPEWTTGAGIWAINGGNLRQTDESIGNTNMYAELNQIGSEAYLYQWSMYVDGTGTNRRGGLHFFVDDPTLPNRGNSYLAWYRIDDNEYHLYKIENDILNLIAVEPVVLDPGTWYDIKVTFDPNSGEIATWIDDNLLNSYTDVNPHTSGSHISLRNGDSEVRYENLKVRKSRIFQQKVTVGNMQKEVRYESPNNQQDACRVNTVINDAAGNWSVQDAKSLYIDWTLPTTVGSVNNNWQTADFTTNFNDNDNVNGSGIMKAFYQVIDYDGNYWSANADRGFYSDNFDQGAIHPDWTVVNGNWNVTNNYLQQTNEAEGNTNIYAYLKQDLSNRYLYNFQMKLDGSGNNKRGGFHYFCDAPTQTNRGNSYFAWFRQELQTLEFYKVTNDTFSQEKVIPIDFDENVWMDVKIVFDRVTGETFVYKDDLLIGEWTDDDPLFTGDYISFRSGNSNMSVNNLKVYRSRYPQVTVTVGNPNADIRYQNPDPNTIAAKVKSIVQDSAQNLSAIDYLELDVDWTAPDDVSYIYDGTAADIDTFYTSSEISANWAASADQHSDIGYYEMSAGTQPGLTDVVNWQNAGNVVANTLSGLTLTPGTTYYVNIRPVNGAGIAGNEIYSDGQYLFSGVGLDELSQNEFNIYPNPITKNGEVTLQFSQSTTEKSSVIVYSTDGKEVIGIQAIPAGSHSVVLKGFEQMAQGTYFVKVIAGEKVMGTEKVQVME